MIGQENDEKGTRLDKLANFPLKLLLTDKQVADICKAFANNSSTNINLSKTQLCKILHSGGFLGRLYGPLLKTGLPLMKNLLIPLRIAAAAAAYAVIHKKILGSRTATTLIIPNEEMEDRVGDGRWKMEYGVYVINLDTYNLIGLLGT